jgi:acetyl esterase/lipase
MVRRTLCVWLLTFVGPAVGSAADFRPDVEYASVGGESLQLDACIPEGEGPFPIAILIHGGGWGGGDKANEYVPPTEQLTKANFAWFSINYRLAPRHRWPACMEDVRTAIDWVKQHAAEFKGDPNRIALIGYSAGGHLAAYAAATANDDARPQALVVLAGPTDLVADCERRGGMSPSLQALFDRDITLDDEARAILRQTSPLNQVTGKMPPSLLIHGTLDVSVPYSQSVNFQAKLKELGTSCDLITIPGGEHRMRDWKSLQPGYEQNMVRFLNRVLGTQP